MNLFQFATSWNARSFVISNTTVPYGNTMAPITSMAHVLVLMASDTMTLKWQQTIRVSPSLSVPVMNISSMYSRLISFLNQKFRI